MRGQILILTTGIAVIAVAIVVPILVSRARKGRRSRVDSAARLMGTGRDIEALTRKHAAAEAARSAQSLRAVAQISR